MKLISKKPVIEILSIEDLEDRLDIPFYKPDLIWLERELLSFSSLKRLEDVLDSEVGITGGATPLGADYLDEGIPFLRVQNIRDMRLKLDSLVFIDEKVHNILKRSQISNGDVLLTITGATFGLSAVYESQEYSISNINQHIVRLRVKTSAISSNFLALFLNSKHGYAQSLRRSTGGSRPALDYKVIKSFYIVCPDIFEQEVILKRYKQISAMADLVTKKLKPIEIDREKTFLKIDQVLSFYLRITVPPEFNNKIRLLPIEEQAERIDWGFYDPSRISTEQQLIESFEKITRINNCGTLFDKTVKPLDTPDEDFQLVRVRWHSKGAVHREIKKGSEISGPLKKVVTNDVVISRIDSTQRAVAIIHPELDGAYVSNEFFVIRLNKEIYLPELLVRIMATKRYVAYLFSQKTGTTKRLRLNEEVILNLPLPDVTPDVQYQTLSELRELDKKLTELNQQKTNIFDVQQHILAAAKANIFDLLDDEKYQRILAMADEVLKTGTTLEVAP